MGTTLKDMRLMAGFKTQESLAAAANITRSVVTKWENGLTYPTPKNMLIMANILGVTVDEILKAIAAKKSETE